MRDSDSRGNGELRELCGECSARAATQASCVRLCFANLGGDAAMRGAFGHEFLYGMANASQRACFSVFRMSVSTTQ